MKAILYDNKSSSERLTYSDVGRPIPADNELLIEIHATSINATDYRMIQMGFPPKKKIFGSAIAGRVESVVKNVKKFK
jgi:NADPH:quinone reductase-like Zn-dependent oxidoreductase